VLRIASHGNYDPTEVMSPNSNTWNVKHCEVVDDYEIGELMRHCGVLSANSLESVERCATV